MMIVFRESGTVCFVNQAEHARLSVEMLDHASVNVTEAVRLATKHHDDGWREYDRVPQFTGGQLIDYRSTPIEDHLTILRRSVKRCANRNPYAGWLVSKHGCSFHQSKSGNRVETFLAEQRQCREALKDDFDHKDQAIRDRDFHWLQFTDAMSLYMLDPWNETLEWNREVPGEVTISNATNHQYTYDGPGYQPGSYSFSFDYRPVDETLSAEPERLVSAYQSTTSRKGSLEFQVLS